MVDLEDDHIRQLNAALEALHFGFRALTAHPDERLRQLGYSRVHHRILYFIGRNPGCSVSELLGIMCVSKQYLNRPLRQLVEDGLVERRDDPADRRIRRLRLTARGGAWRSSSPASSASSWPRCSPRPDRVPKRAGAR
ncbi:MarR family winged helix-turn-helix transcriptional regulator [endosymbiont of unidentified scaly snail isolate Monju]|uniref:MarR family winged helix-turn-helix transcriptional regulator n=1 Tax=endosymbiont of unidentified scaly snail isolate Monju TaxID=1248727 RepID=UPI0005D4BF4C|nr:MarR family transcriptional regulator [endosymbiont of unidentified scaly snail isolate Monju]